MKYAIFFDVDDTLYDQVVPFKQAFEECFSQCDVNIEEVYLRSRYLSDAVFEETQAGVLPIEKMHIYRIQGALDSLGYRISDEKALHFQETYANYQEQISLSPTIKECLNLCQEHQVLLGLITNGPTEHQKKKIRQLKLSKWIDSKNIFISSELGFVKPQVEIFDCAAQSVADGYERYYIGDSFPNDILGAYHAQWKPIWLNKRKRTPGELAGTIHFVEVSSEDMLLQHLQMLLGSL